MKRVVWHGVKHRMHQAMKQTVKQEETIHLLLVVKQKATDTFHHALKPAVWHNLKRWMLHAMKQRMK